jgi:hypothetical protein
MCLFQPQTSNLLLAYYNVKFKRNVLQQNVICTGMKVMVVSVMCLEKHFLKR